MRGWEPEELTARREVLGLDPSGHSDPRPRWHGRAWEATPVYVVDDNCDEVVTYLPEGAEIGFVEGDWPTRDGKHPWYGKPHWEGHGCLIVQREDRSGARLPADWHLPPCLST